MFLTLVSETTLTVPLHGVTRNVKIPQSAQVRMKHGLFLTLDLDTQHVRFTKKNLDDMILSKDIQVEAFLRAHATLLNAIGTSEGTLLGLYFGLVPEKTKTPVPCFAAWSLPQMLETTPNLQQCVKTTVTAGAEYFFILTENIGDIHALIYVHQTINSLCLHRLDENGNEDELALCAQNMATVSPLQDAIEMYVCTNYLKQEKKLRIMV